MNSWLIGRSYSTFMQRVVGHSVSTTEMRRRWREGGEGDGEGYVEEGRTRLGVKCTIYSPHLA